MSKKIKASDKVIYQGHVSDKKGNALNTQREAWKKDADCGCGIDCCNNKIALPVNDSSTDATYDASFQFVNVGGTIKLRVTVDLGAGPVVKEVSLA